MANKQKITKHISSKSQVRGDAQKDRGTPMLSKRLRGLAAFLPLFEEPGFTFGQWSEVKKTEPGVITLPFFTLSNTADAFVRAAHDLEWVRHDFDWPKWMQTTEARRLRDKEDALASATSDQLARLLTVVIRQERFCEGSLASAYDSGLLTGILRRAAALESEIELDKPVKKRRRCTSAAVFPIRRVNALRRRLQKRLELPHELPEGWSLSDLDFNELMGLVPSLKIRKGIKLQAHLFREGENGNGVVYAVPEDMSPENAQFETIMFNNFLPAPRPIMALKNLMEAFEGNGTPWSYMCASILAREFEEYGAQWHGCDWSTHYILGENPLVKIKGSGRRRSSRLEISDPDGWDWLQDEPGEWNPQGITRGRSCKVVFYTHTGFDVEALYRHEDTYKDGSYHFKSKRTMIARGPGGYIF